MLSIADNAVVNSPELTKGEETGFEFVHKSFGEYLAGEQIADTLERASFKIQEYDSGEWNWRMSISDAACAVGAAIGIRLLPAEVQEMLEPMVGNYQAFLSGKDVNETVTREAIEQGLSTKGERAQKLLQELCAGRTLGDLLRGTKGSTLIRSELEAYANYAAGLLALGAAISRRLDAIGHQNKQAQAFAINSNDLWRAVHIVEAGGVSIDETLALRLFAGLSAGGNKKKVMRVEYPPLEPSKLRHVKDLEIGVREELGTLLRLQVKERQTLLALLQLAINRSRTSDESIGESLGFIDADFHYVARAFRFAIEPSMEHGWSLIRSGLVSAELYEEVREWGRYYREVQRLVHHLPTAAPKDRIAGYMHYLFKLLSEAGEARLPGVAMGRPRYVVAAKENRAKRPRKAERAEKVEGRAKE